MLKKLRDLFSSDAEQLRDDEATLHLAAAALLIEVARSDHSLQQLEVARLRDVLAQHWGLDEADLDDLVAVARSSAETSVSLHQHIDQINRHYSAAQKVDLVRGLWDVAVADDHIHHHEEALIRRLADLLYVSHTDFIRCKHLALDARAGFSGRRVDPAG